MKVNVMQVGPIGTNCYILKDETTGKAAVIDPGDEAERILAALKEDGAEVTHILLTHGHYDHTTAVPELEKALPLAGQVDGLNFYDEGDHIPVGSLDVQVLHTPGHSKGSVTLKVGDVLFTGDTLFCGSCGRTDLRGGSYEEIMASLKRLGQLEGDYHVCPGHDRTSTLERERQYNPFLREALGQRS